MMNEQEYISRLETETGLKLGKDFGFMMGTSSPFISDGNHVSAVNHRGYIIWKRKTNDNGESTTVELKTPGLSFEETVEFLKASNEETVKFFTDQGFTLINHKGEVVDKSE